MILRDVGALLEASTSSIAIKNLLKQYVDLKLGYLSTKIITDVTGSPTCTPDTVKLREGSLTALLQHAAP